MLRTNFLNWCINANVRALRVVIDFWVAAFAVDKTETTKLGMCDRNHLHFQLLVHVFNSQENISTTNLLRWYPLNHFVWVRELPLPFVPPFNPSKSTLEDLGNPISRFVRYTEEGEEREVLWNLHIASVQWLSWIQLLVVVSVLRSPPFWPLFALHLWVAEKHCSEPFPS